MESGKGLSGAAIVLVLVLFFMPWITVSCGGTNIVTLSGFDLAAGTDVGFGENLPADPLLFVIPLAALVAAFFAFGSSSNKQSGGGQIICASVGLGALVLKAIAMQENQIPAVNISYEIGLWGTIGGFALLLIAGWMSYAESEQTKTSSGSSPTESQEQEVPEVPFFRMVKLGPESKLSLEESMDRVEDEVNVRPSVSNRDKETSVDEGSTLAQSDATTLSPKENKTPQEADFIEQLERLERLRKEGLLDEDEFKAAKARILGL